MHDANAIHCERCWCVLAPGGAMQLTTDGRWVCEACVAADVTRKTKHVDRDNHVR